MIKPKFNNVPNEHLQLNYKSNNGDVKLDYWISRAPAVVGVIFAITPKEMLVLTTKRSNNMRDEKNKLGVPCGYLDWNENGYEGMAREVYEETSLYLPDYDDLLITNNKMKPFDIKDDPNEDMHQNVSLLYTSFYDFRENMNRFPNYIETYKNYETNNVKWMNCGEFFMPSQNIQWAFNHDKVIVSAHKFLTWLIKVDYNLEKEYKDE